MRKSLILFVLLAVYAISTIGQPADEPRVSKRPWQWSDTDRIAARLDASYIHKHMKSDGGQVAFSINGRETPQLFLPYELFNSLMGGLNADVTFRDTTRAMLYEHIKSFGYADPDAFWNELERIVAPHLALVRRTETLRNQLRGASRPDRDAIAREIERSSIPLCRSRADALASARAHFGRETFDRFLYSVVAPQLSVNAPLPSADEARGLAYVEGGCR
jgi:hypothetical protein